MNIFLTRLKCLLRNKTLVFWTLLFPIVLSTFFKLAFANLGKNDVLNTINIAIINNNTLNQDFLTIAKEAEFSEDKKMFNIELTDLATAEKLLNEGKIIGIVEMKGTYDIHLSLTSGGINQTILKAFLDEYLHTYDAVYSIILHTPGANPEEVIKALTMNTDYLKQKDNGTRTPTYVLNYFYSLIGMTLMYGSFWGTEAVTTLQPNLSPHGLRMAISPTKRFKLIFLHLLASFCIHFIEIILFILYMIFILGIDFGSNLILLIATCSLGSITGILFGTFISLLLKRASEGIKIAITTLTGLVGGFLSGMMVISIKYFVQTNLPFLQFINPVGVITDALYSLGYYTTLERYWLNMGILAIMSIIFLVVSTLIFRRDNYESI